MTDDLLAEIDRLRAVIACVPPLVLAEYVESVRLKAKYEADHAAFIQKCRLTRTADMKRIKELVEGAGS